MRICAIGSIEIYAPASGWHYIGAGQRSEGNPPFGSPHMTCGVHLSGVLETGIPLRIIERVLLQIYFQVEPLIGGGNLEFKIVERPLWVGRDESFHHVFLPESPALYARILAFEHIQGLIVAPEREVKIISRPAACHFRLQFGIWGTGEACLIEAHPWSGLP